VSLSLEREKQVAAEAAADLVENGMTVGLGTGSTVAYLLPALAKRSLDIVCAATSPRTEHAARELGLRIEDVTSIRPGRVGRPDRLHTAYLTGYGRSSRSARLRAHARTGSLIAGQVVVSRHSRLNPVAR